MIKDITNVTIWGNHSATQYPDIFHVKVNGKNAAETINDLKWLEEDFIPTVQKRGAAIIEARGASSAASPPTPRSTTSTMDPGHAGRRLGIDGDPLGWLLRRPGG